MAEPYFILNVIQFSLQRSARVQNPIIARSALPIRNAPSLDSRDHLIIHCSAANASSGFSAKKCNSPSLSKGGGKRPEISHSLPSRVHERGMGPICLKLEKPREFQFDANLSEISLVYILQCDARGGRKPTYKNKAEGEETLKQFRRKQFFVKLL